MAALSRSVITRNRSQRADRCPHEERGGHWRREPDRNRARQPPPAPVSSSASASTQAGPTTRGACSSCSDGSSRRERRRANEEILTMSTRNDAASRTSINLYWLPLGAGGHFVRLNGRVYEAVAARLGRRPVCDLHHSALEVRVPEGRFVIEQAPIRASDGAERGVVAEGAVGSCWAGRLRMFRYEVRRWPDGVIPDVAEAVESLGPERRPGASTSTARARALRANTRVG